MRLYRDRKDKAPFLPPLLRQWDGRFGKSWAVEPHRRSAPPSAQALARKPPPQARTTMGWIERNARQVLQKAQRNLIVLIALLRQTYTGISIRVKVCRSER